MPRLVTITHDTQEDKVTIEIDRATANGTPDKTFLNTRTYMTKEMAKQTLEALKELLDE